MEANVELYKEEYEKLMRSGYLMIDDPERGHVEFWMLFDENHQGIKGKQLRVTVHRSGEAVIKVSD